MEKLEITAEVASQLVAEQFPQWGHLTITPVELNGWDNTTFRLGDDLSLRLPSGDHYVQQLDKERRWLPVLAPHLPLPIPQPVASGVPGSGSRADGRCIAGSQGATQRSTGSTIRTSWQSRSPTFS